MVNLGNHSIIVIPFLLLAACSNGSGNRELSSDEKETATVFEEKIQFSADRQGLALKRALKGLSTLALM